MEGPEGEPSLVLLGAALAGDRQAIRRLVQNLTPTIQAQAARILLRSPASRAVSVRAEVQEWVQEVFCLLFKDQGKILRVWDPSKGASLEGFVGLVARRYIRHQLAVKSRYAVFSLTQGTEDVDAFSAEEPGVDHEAARREYLLRVLKYLQDGLSEQGVQMFQQLYIEGRPPEEVAAASGLSRDAVYKWRSRLKQEAERAAERVARTGAGELPVRGGVV